MFTGDTCPTCGNKATLVDCEKAERVKGSINRPIVAYLDNGVTFAVRIYSRKCGKCQGVAFPFHHAPSDSPKSKLPLPAEFENDRFCQFGELTLISKVSIDRFNSHIALACPEPVESHCKIRTMLQKVIGGYMETEGGSSKCEEERAALDRRRLSQAIFMQEMKIFVQRHATSLMPLFDWGTKTELELFKLVFPGMFEHARARFLNHMEVSRNCGAPKLCGEIFNLDGFCQLARTHCAHELGPDPTHPFDRSAVMCPASVVRCKDSSKYSVYCREHAPLHNEQVNDEDEDFVSEDSDVSATGATTSVVQHKHNACQKEYAEAERILCQARNETPDSNERLFHVKWRSKQVGDTTVEPEKLLPADIVKAWDDSVGTNVKVYDMEIDSAGRPLPWDVVAATATMCNPCTTDLLSEDAAHIPLASNKMCTLKDSARGPHVAHDKGRVKSRITSVTAAQTPSKPEMDDGYSDDESERGDSERTTDEDTDPSKGKDVEMEGVGDKRKQAEVKSEETTEKRKCTTGKLHNTTFLLVCATQSLFAGTLHGHCGCGYPAPPLEMIKDEGCTMVCPVV